MKKNIIMLIVTLLAMGTATFSQVKVGVIDSHVILEKSQKGKHLQKAMHKLTLEKQDQMRAMQKTIAKLEKELRSLSLDSATRERKNIEYQNKKKELTRFYDDTNVELQQRYSKEFQAILKEVEPIIEALGKEKRFTIIFDNAQPLMSYYDETVDITAEVIRIYDSGQ